MLDSIISASLSGGLVWLFMFKTRKKKEVIDNDTAASDNWQELYEAMKAERDDLKTKLNELINVSVTQRARITELENDLKYTKCANLKCNTRE